MKVKVIKPHREKQIRDDISSIMVLKQNSSRSLPKLSPDPTEVSTLYSAVNCHTRTLTTGGRSELGQEDTYP